MNSSEISSSRADETEAARSSQPASRSVDASRFMKVPVAEITSPEKPGPLRVIKDHWWAVTEDDCVLIYTHRGSNTPQCNINRTIVERVLCPELQKGVTFIPYAYLKFDPRDCE